MHLPADMAIVGRDREQAELAAALASTRAGHGRAVLLLGEAGMGKSMIADSHCVPPSSGSVKNPRKCLPYSGLPTPHRLVTK